jgi:hypothetical protein
MGVEFEGESVEDLGAGEANIELPATAISMLPDGKLRQGAGENPWLGVQLPHLSFTRMS